ncbi:MAG: PEGA domain-containing protein [Kofleriaceae bacterium]|nr:PEGA domain-containing protein [Kofleriaceae bacterium]
MGGRSFALVLAAALLPLPAWADDEQPVDTEGESTEAHKDPRAAKTWIAAGRELMAKGDTLARRNRIDHAKTQWANAATAFEKAIKWGADPNVYADLAAAEEKLGKLDAAATHYRTLMHTKSGVKSDVLKRAKARFDDLSMRVGLVTLVVKPEGATISIAGAEVGKAPMAEPLILMPGQYTVSFAADGHQPKDLDVKVDEGSDSERKVELEAITINVTAPEPVDEEEAGPVVASAGPSKLPLYIGGGASIGFAAIGLVTGILAVGKHGTFTDPDSSTPQRDDAKSSGTRFAVITDVALGGAVIAAGFTAYWYFAKYRPAQAKHSSESASASRSKFLMAPWVQPDAGGFKVAGSF